MNGKRTQHDNDTSRFIPVARPGRAGRGPAGPLTGRTHRGGDVLAHDRPWPTSVDLRIAPKSSAI